MGKLTLKHNFPQPLNGQVREIIDEFNGRVGFGTAADGTRGTNLDCEYQTHTFGGTPDTEESVTHTLGRTPVGFLVVRIDKAAIVYESDFSNWSSTTAKFKCDTATVATTILLF